MKKKKDLIIGIAIFLLGFCFSSYITPLYFPDLLMLGAKKKIGNEENLFKHGELPEAGSNFVVKPNPDFLYSTCFYDLSDGPIKMVGDLPDSSYWSIGIYEMNTVNYFVKNDQQFNSSHLELNLHLANQSVADKGENIIAPSKKGLILFRILVTDRDPQKIKRITEMQQSIHLEKI